MTMRLSMSSLTGTARTLVAIGTVRLSFMFVTMRAEAPRRMVGSTFSAADGRRPRATGTAGGAGGAATGAAGTTGASGCGAACDAISASEASSAASTSALCAARTAAEAATRSAPACSVGT